MYVQSRFLAFLFFDAFCNIATFISFMDTAVHVSHYFLSLSLSLSLSRRYLLFHLQLVSFFSSIFCDYNNNNISTCLSFQLLQFDFDFRQSF